MDQHEYINLAVIGITCWVSFLGFRDPAFKEKYFFWPQAILAWKEYYRLVTAGFLHLNFYHLLVNMMSLYFFGPAIEAEFGPVQFLIIYLAAIVGGNLLALFVHRHHDYRALGASGGVSGIIFAYILFFPGSSILPFYFLPIAIPSWLYAIAFLLLSFHGMQRNLGNIGHDAHLGGALVGLFTAAVLHPAAIRYNAGLFAAILAAAILLAVYLVRNPLMLPLEGVDFTKSGDRPSKGFSLRTIFGLPRLKKQSAPSPPTQKERQIDLILQKVSEHGIHSLTKDERNLLDSVSQKYRQRAERKKPDIGFPF
jgi:membrane associated rhomboid family serine protease